MAFAAFALAGAQFGLNVLAAQQQKEAAIAQANFREFSLKRQGRLSARQRRIQFADALSSQRAQIASSGIVGGRTSRLLRAEAQNTLTTSTQNAQSQLRSKIAGVDISKIRAQQRFSANIMKAIVNTASTAMSGGKASAAASFGSSGGSPASASALAEL